MQKSWQLAKVVSDKFKNQFPEINQIILQLLYNRGLDTQEKIDEFTNPDYGSDIHDPFLFLEMSKGVKRTLQAIEKKEKIVVYGDYDADGVSSTAIMASALKALGAQVEVYIPFRETEGYGLNLEAVDLLVKNKTKLVVTVDCGVSNEPEIARLNQNRVDVIITDHHKEPLTLPQAYAIINPTLSREHYPFKHLAGCGVAYKFVQALMLEHANYQVERLPDGWEKWLLDLVAIGTVTDLMPLLGENRTLVQYGLVVLKKTKRFGLKMLAEVLKTEIRNFDEHSIGFQIGPRLNAAGRLNHANSAYQLLITEDETQAKRLAQELDKTNQDRQKLTEQIYNEALTIIGQPEGQDVLVALGNGWPTGIVGLVAGRLSDRFYRPSFVISRFGNEIIGSGRSIKGVDITKMLQQCDKYLARYGGHSQACGFTIKDEENVEPFIKKINGLVAKQLTKIELVPMLNIDAEVQLEDIDWPLYEKIQDFSPFGNNNPKPAFLAQGLTVKELQTVGQDAKHLRLMVSHSTPMVRKTIGFSLGGWSQKIKSGQAVDMVFEVDVNMWNGNKELQLKIIDLKISDEK